MVSEPAAPTRWYRTWSWRPDPGGAAGRGPAAYAIDRLAGAVGALLRAGIALVGGLAAVLDLAPPARVGWVLPAVALSCAWAGLFGVVALRRGLTTPLLVGELALTSALCLAQVRLTARDALPAGASWVEVLTTVTIVLAQFRWRPAVGVPAGLAVVAAYVLGAVPARLADHGLTQAAIYVVQVGSAAALMWLIRRAGARADAALARTAEADRQAELARVRRAQERAYNRRLHDTVLATLTMVGTGGLESSSRTLRERAAGDLAVIEALASGDAGTVTDGLAGRLHAAVDAVGDRLSVRLDLTGLSTEDTAGVPGEVVDAFAAATAEALVNVARHAGTGDAAVAVRDADGTVTVEISDRGRGFDPGSVPAHRYGLREAVAGRMRAVGGRAEIASGPGEGTRVLLVWDRG